MQHTVCAIKHPVSSIGFADPAISEIADHEPNVAVQITQKSGQSSLGINKNRERIATLPAMNTTCLRDSLSRLNPPLRSFETNADGEVSHGHCICRAD